MYTDTYAHLNFISINILTFINCDKHCIIPMSPE